MQEKFRNQTCIHGKKIKINSNLFQCIIKDFWENKLKNITFSCQFDTIFFKKIVTEIIDF